jgi:two-component system CitB family sensor kinase
VPPALSQRVFEAGYSTKSTAAGQRGIGLALVKRLVVQHAGELSVHNHEGAVFTVGLPLVKAGTAPTTGKAHTSA